MNLSPERQPAWMLASACIGLVLGTFTAAGTWSAELIEPFLMVLLYMTFLSVGGENLKAAFHNISFAAAAGAVNFLWTPLLSCILGLTFFPHSTDLQIGLLMLLATPCTDWYLVFTGMAGGNVPLGASILPLNLFLQIALLPVYLFLFFGSRLPIDHTSLLLSMVIVLAIPFVLAALTKQMGKRNLRWKKYTEYLKRRGDTLQLFCLCLAIAAMFASESRNLWSAPILFLHLLGPMILFFSLTFMAVRLLACRKKYSRQDAIALHFTTLARNSPLSLAIAAAAFPERPLIAMVLVIAPLIELPILTMIAHKMKGPA